MINEYTTFVLVAIVVLTFSWPSNDHMTRLSPFFKGRVRSHYVIRLPFSLYWGVSFKKETKRKWQVFHR